MKRRGLAPNGTSNWRTARSAGATPVAANGRSPGLKISDCTDQEGHTLCRQDPHPNLLPEGEGTASRLSDDCEKHLPFSPLGRDGREAPVRAREWVLGEGWYEGGFSFR